jgi:glycosyltransferase involved in cell wall biosynthesis
MRILHLAKHCANSNGNAHVAVDLACTQAAKGHVVAYASAGGYYVDLLAAKQVAVETVDQGSYNVVRIARSVFSLMKLCVKMKPDIIHAHMMSSALIGYVVSKLTRVPLVTTVHNSFDRHSVLMRVGHLVVAVGQAEKKLLLSRGFREDRLVAIANGPNGSPREAWRSHESTEAEVISVPCIATVCGLHARKGVHDLIRAFAGTHRDFPHWHLNIAGEGPDLPMLVALADELGVSRVTHFLGSMKVPQTLLKQSAIFVLASYAEPFGLAVAEARSEGCAIIATDVGGIPEVLEFGEAGRLVSPGQPEQIEKELRALMSNPNELAVWQARSRNGAQYFSVDRMADDYERAYEGVLKKTA